MLQICPLGYVTLPWIAQLTVSVSIELVSSSARVTSVKSQQVLDGHPDPTIGPQVYLGPIKKRISESLSHSVTDTTMPPFELSTDSVWRAK